MIVVLSTVPPEKARTIAKALVEEKLVGCVNIVPGVTSIYKWKGNIEEDAEYLLIMKTVKNNYRRLEKRLKELHPYEVPELIVLPIEGGNPDYLTWLGEVSDRREVDSE